MSSHDPHESPKPPNLDARAFALTFLAIGIITVGLFAAYMPDFLINAYK